MSPELHMFVLWEHARPAEERILADLRERFRIVRAHEIRWTPEHVSRNYSRFYGTKLPPRSEKIRHCGAGPFLLVVVEDRQPAYADRPTSKGTLRVNTRTFDAKALYREWTGGGHRVHGTNDPDETRHDLLLMLGEEPDAIAAGTASPWSGAVDALERDLIGTGGWRDLDELFTVLDATQPYVVLRNFEHYPDLDALGPHPDVDLLTTDPVELVYAADGVRLFPQRYRTAYRTTVAGRRVDLDVRHVGDGYYDAAWQTDILATRRRHAQGFWVPEPVQWFHALLYHGLLHKRRLADDYATRLAEHSEAVLGQPVQRGELQDPAAARRILDRFLGPRGYRVTEPRDLSVHFRSSLAPEVRVSLRRRMKGWMQRLADARRSALT